MSDESTQQFALLPPEGVVQARTFVHKDQLAHLLGVTPRTITSWQEQTAEPLPTVTAGQSGRANQYDLKACIVWFVEHTIRQRVQLAPDGNALDLDYERARLAKAQADHQEMNNRARRAQLIPADLVMRVQGGMVTNARSRLLALPVRVAPRVAGMRSIATIAAAITEEVHIVLQELSEFDAEQYQGE